MSLMKKYFMFMFQVLLPLYDLLFASICITLWFSWYTTVLFGVISWESSKYCIHGICGITSSILTTSTYVEPFVFVWWFPNLHYTAPFPNNMHPLVWFLISRCTAYNSSTHHFFWTVHHLLMLRVGLFFRWGASAILWVIYSHTHLFPLPVWWGRQNPFGYQV